MSGPPGGDSHGGAFSPEEPTALFGEGTGRRLNLTGGLALLLAFTGQATWLAGLWAILHGRIRIHRRRMLVGGALLLAHLLLVWVPRLLTGVRYAGRYHGAHRLLVSLQLGLGFTALAGVALALWCVREGAWDLHRRAGMFALMSGLFAWVAGEVLTGLLWWT